MKFNDFDKMMREHEQSIDQFISASQFMVARLDGRGFTKLTKDYDKPFSDDFHAMMLKTTEALMTCGFHVTYGYTQSDEISLLFDKFETGFNRKVRKYDSILGGTASAAFSLQVGTIAVLDCRMIPLDTVEDVCDYFLWRQEDSIRNALNAYCYWTLRQHGKSARAASRAIENKSVAEKHELLEKLGVEYDKIAAWKKYGAGMTWETVGRVGTNPLTGEETEVSRSVLRLTEELPKGPEYARFIGELCRPMSIK